MLELNYANFEVQTTSYVVAGTDQGIVFVGGPNRGLPELQAWYPEASLGLDNQKLRYAISELKAFLIGDLRQFDLPIDLQTGTVLQQRVWAVLQKVPYGQQMTYSDLAALAGYPRAVRAVASAVALNPLLLIIPCHRIVRKDGQLGQYRGGVAMKQALLHMESRVAQANSSK